jgi:protease-4
MLQANIEHGYARFVGLVARSRGKTPQQVDAIAQGRVWDGGTARQLDLVDQFGGLDDALAWVAAQAKLGDSWHPVFLGEQRSPYAALIERLTGTSQDGGSAMAGVDLPGLVAARQRGLVGRAVAQAEQLLNGRGAQALCLDCPASANESGAGPDSASLLVQLARLLGF